MTLDRANLSKGLLRLTVLSTLSIAGLTGGLSTSFAAGLGGSIGGGHGLGASVGASVGSKGISAGVSATGAGTSVSAGAGASPSQGVSAGGTVSSPQGSGGVAASAGGSGATANAGATVGGGASVAGASVSATAGTSGAANGTTGTAGTTTGPSASGPATANAAGSGATAPGIGGAGRGDASPGGTTADAASDDASAGYAVATFSGPEDAAVPFRSDDRGTGTALDPERMHCSDFHCRVPSFHAMRHLREVNRLRDRARTTAVPLKQKGRDTTARSSVTVVRPHVQPAVKRPERSIAQTSTHATPSTARMQGTKPEPAKKAVTVRESDSAVGATTVGRGGYPSQIEPPSKTAEIASPFAKAALRIFEAADDPVVMHYPPASKAHRKHPE